jgi:hypothetical protein
MSWGRTGRYACSPRARVYRPTVHPVGRARGRGTLTIIFTYLFGMERAWMHAVVVAGLTTAVCLILYVIAVLDYPFNSGVSVQPDAFELVLRVIQG